MRDRKAYYAQYACNEKSMARIADAGTRYRYVRDILS